MITYNNIFEKYEIAYYNYAESERTLQVQK